LLHPRVAASPLTPPPHHRVLIPQILGDKGVHARSAVGTNALPLNVPVEIEAIVEVEE